MTSGLADFFLATHPYRTWSLSSLANLSANASLVRYDIGATISFDQRIPSQISLIGKGVLALTVSLANGLDQTLAHLHAGTLLGLTSAFGDRAPGEDQFYRVHFPAILWQFQFDTFRACMAKDWAMAETVVGVLATHARLMTDEVANAAMLTARARLARFLLNQTTQNAAHIPLSDQRANIPLSQAQTAKMLGLSRQTTGLFLREFESAGLVRLGRNRIDLVNPAALLGIVNG